MTKILIIEDEQPILEEIMLCLEFEGYEPLGAEDGLSGVDAATHHHPDLILCDISMPAMDGYQVLQSVRSNHDLKLIPFIFLTAHGDRNFVRHGMELGADDYLTKPFTRSELLRAIRTRIERKSAIAETYQQEVENAKRELARLISHELKTPMISAQFVREMIDRRLDQLTPDEIKELLQTLSAGTDRLYHLVEQMVYWTRLETGVITREAMVQSGGTIYLEQFIPTAINLARRYAWRNTENNIVTRIYDNNVTVMGMVEPLRHAVAEIIANAQNFSDEQSIVTVSEWVTDDHVVISVLDTGKGMSPEELAHAQKAFGQVNREQYEQQGLGVGLNVAARIVDAYNGQLQMKSAVGKGTQVDILLPLAEQAS
jgi:two-component system, sensor histidine kinase and response regulator